MATQILLKRSSVAAKIPLAADLQLGELAINTTDGKLFLKKNNTVVEIGPVLSVAGRTGEVVLSTSDVTEGTNLYFTNARASAAAPVQSVAGRTGAVTLTKTDVGLANVENKSSATIRSELTSANVTAALGFTPTNSASNGSPNGVATLDGNGKILSSQLPSIALTDTFVVATQAAMLALVAQTGDVAVRTDLRKSFILKGTNAATLEDWQELLTPSDVVQSVAGRTGAVTLNTADVAEGTNLYFTNARASAAAPVQSVSGRTGAVTLTKADVALSNVENKSSATIRSEISSNNVIDALSYVPTKGAYFVGQYDAAGISAIDLRNITNPLTGIGYARGARFRFGSANDANSAQGYADIIDLSTYTDATGGGFNSLYLNKASQYIEHKWAPADGTAWTTKTLAYTDSNISGTATNVTGTVAVTNGGTGATNAAQARTNLGAQAALGFTPIQQGGGTGHSGNKIYIGWAADSSGLLAMVDTTNFGVNWPINSRNVTGTVAVANGGTGATTAEAAATNLGVSRVNPTAAKTGDVRVLSGVISVYDGSAWKQVFPAVYA